MMTSYVFTNSNVIKIKNIDSFTLPVSILYTQNFSLLERIMITLSDAAITNEHDTLLKTLEIKKKIIKNLDTLSLYNIDITYTRASFEYYFEEAYSFTSTILVNPSSIKLAQIKPVQKMSKKIFYEFKENKERAKIKLATSLKEISNDSKIFFSTSFIISLIGFLLVFSFGLFIYLNIHRRFNSIIESVENLSVKKPDVNLLDNTQDELSTLVTLFNKISKELKNINQTLKQEVYAAIQKTKLQEQELIQQSRLAQMGEMLSMIAHQWRQPLNIISAIGMSLHYRASCDTLVNVEVIQKVKKISKHIEHMSSTIDDFKNFFKPDKEKVQTDYNIIIKSVLSLIEASIKHHNIKITVDAQDVISMLTYQNELIQVVLNILKNAEDALLENKVSDPLIIVTIYQDEAYNILKIQDNAGGIQDTIIDKIFDPYFSTKDKKEGTGLGLYMSKIIVTDHCNGLLHVENYKKGTLFTIKLLKI
ncbi:HAMP domain-containing histidine kinase [Sulfurimonas sp. SAG-AH-194-I05]|nr:HAMP domain-containing sensor histidine kinase [Sulfurimonas sp. SAG-AH-194-I05]MDF1875551.1 HAMP domain-containing histidine kinase [Sulfurimonas sp. SAG-AH-194-I05]